MQLHHELAVCMNGPHPLHSTTDQFLKDTLTQLSKGLLDNILDCIFAEFGNFKLKTERVIDFTPIFIVFREIGHPV